MENSTSTLQSARPSMKMRSSRASTMPFASSSRTKPRRIPLVFRFYKGAIHRTIAVPVILHTLFAVAVVLFDSEVKHGIGLPPTIIPSLSIVVGLMLVFRNQTSYSRFWDGRNHISVICTSVRNLTRSFLACSTDALKSPNREAELADTESIVKILVAMLYSLKNHLRGDWGAYADRVRRRRSMTMSQESPIPEYTELMPPGLVPLENHGVGTTLQLAILVEEYIKRGYRRDWWNAPQSSQLTAQLNTLITAYGSTETIRLTQVPVSHLIHQKQVLALFGALLPFATVTDLEWWTVPITAAVTFTLYGIDGIAMQLEDPFGFDRVDIPLDNIVEDMRTEILVLLDEWKAVCMDSQGSSDGREQWFSYHSQLD